MASLHLCWEAREQKSGEKFRRLGEGMRPSGFDYFVRCLGALVYGVS